MVEEEAVETDMERKMVRDFAPTLLCSNHLCCVCYTHAFEISRNTQVRVSRMSYIVQVQHSLLKTLFAMHPFPNKQNYLLVRSTREGHLFQALQKEYISLVREKKAIIADANDASNIFNREKCSDLEPQLCNVNLHLLVYYLAIDRLS